MQVKNNKHDGKDYQSKYQKHYGHIYQMVARESKKWYY